MVNTNAKIEASRVRGDQEGIQHGSYGNEREGIRPKSTGTGNQSITADRDDRTGRTITSPGGQGTPGGIVDRLISKMKTLIEESENRTADLKEQLEELVQLSQQLQEQEDSQ